MRECEIKFQVSELPSFEDVLSRITALPYSERHVRNEIDFVPDDQKNSLRRAGLLLRFRKIQASNAEPRTLVTLKSVRRNRRLQDHAEIEFFTGDGNCVKKAREISRAISVKSEISIDPELIASVEFGKCVDYARSALGLTSIRALIEKDREIYIGADFDICIDSFPEPVGKFLEVSSTTPKGVAALCKTLGLAVSSGDSRTYGQIVEQALQRVEVPHTRVLLSAKNGKYLQHCGLEFPPSSLTSSLV